MADCCAYVLKAGQHELICRILTTPFSQTTIRKLDMPAADTRLALLYLTYSFGNQKLKGELKRKTALDGKIRRAYKKINFLTQIPCSL